MKIQIKRIPWWKLLSSRFCGGKDSLPTKDDYGKLLYCVATIQEIQRLSCVAPATLLHTTTKDVDVKGYKIKKGTRIIANLTKFMMDPSIFSKPQCFIPERFIQEEEDDLENEIKLKVRSFIRLSNKIWQKVKIFQNLKSIF